MRPELRLIFAIASIQQGKLLEVSPETMLPRGVRLSCPGKETKENFVTFLMDASGVCLFVIDLSNGDYVKLDFTEAEQKLFNAFELGEGATNINLMEMWSVAVAMVTFGANHTNQVLTMRNDNTSAEAWTNKNRHRNPKVEQMLVLVAIGELIFKQSVWGERVATWKNWADVPTRAKRKEEFLPGLKKLGEDYGWKNPTGRELQVEEWFRDFGMDELTPEGNRPRWCRLAESFVKSIEKQHPKLIAETCGVPATELLEAFRLAESSEDLPPITGEEDFSDMSSSEERLHLTGLAQD